jgi:hypothetical protein
MTTVMNKSAPHTNAVMAGLVPAIHDLTPYTKDVNARHEAGHDDAERPVP